jgi:monothiol glutaredoxin
MTVRSLLLLLALFNAAAGFLPSARFASSSRSARTTVTMGATALERVEEMVSKHKVFLFMKGTKIFPQCGFSNTVVQVLDRLDVEYETFDVLADEEIRQAAKDFARWPTIPQLYVDGEFAGGSDIVIEQYESGELKRLLTGDPDAEVVETPMMKLKEELKEASERGDTDKILSITYQMLEEDGSNKNAPKSGGSGSPLGYD